MDTIKNIRITDNGTGICYEELPIKFKKFYESQKRIANENNSGEEWLWSPSNGQLSFNRALYRSTGFVIRLLPEIPADCKSAGTKLPVAVPSGLLTKPPYTKRYSL